METIIQLIFIIALAKFALQAAQGGKYYILALYAVFMSAFAFALYPIVINQPLTIITQLLENRTIVENTALLTTAESIIGIFISIYLLNNYFKPKQKRTKTAIVVKIFPGILAIIGAAYFELQFFKFMAGTEFIYTAIWYSAILFVAISAVGLIYKFLISSESAKLELRLILDLAILALGLLVSSSVAEYNISHAVATIEWGALITVIIGTIFTIGIGYSLYKLDIANKIKQLIKWN